MSFTTDIKNELTKTVPEKKCCQLAEIAGFLRFAGSITLSSGKMGIKVTTDNPAVARVFIRLIKEYFGAKTALSLGEPTPLGKGRVYELSVTPQMNSEQILREVGILGVREGSNYITDGFDPAIVRKRCCKKAALRGAFLACGLVADPRRSYNMELICGSEYMAQDVRRTVNSFGLKAKVRQRRSKYVVYLRESEQIGDLLNIIGATNAYFQFQEVQLVKENLNKTNRIANCETANVEKQVNAAQKQLADIRVIEETKGLGALPARLQETAMMRKAHPELSLEDLAAVFDPPLKKSGLSHRFARLAEEANKMRAYRSEEFRL
ncbi:MAG: DNA-binding protein WhiA [Clostridia bacterium]|nr:DNA-binding protein WhiA [Clostridia bacterium]